MLLGREHAGQIGAELGFKQRNAVGAAALVADGVFADDFIQFGAVVEFHRQRVGDRALVRVVVVAGVGRVFHADDLVAQDVDARVARDLVFVVAGSQAAEQHGHRHHVLDAVVAVGGVVQRPLLVDDADARFMRADRDGLDVVRAFAQRLELCVDVHGAFHSGLRMEFRRERDLEQHVLHHVAAIRPLELERLPLEQHVVKAPGLGAKYRRVTHFAGFRDQRQAHGTAGSVARGPALAAAGVRRVAIRAQALAVYPGQRHGVDDFVAVQPQHLGHHRGGRHLDQHHVVQADLVEGILQRDAALDFMRLDHAGQHVTHGQRGLAGGDSRARQPIGRGQDAAQIVGRVPPFGGQPGVVEIQPADHRADVERGLHGVKLERRAGHLGAVWHHGAGHDRPQQLLARRVFQRFQAAAQRVDQAVACGLVRQAALDLVVKNVVRDIDQDLIGIGTYV
ncbi:hypothetical protein D3C73_846730 [compost metagenome]